MSIFKQPIRTLKSHLINLPGWSTRRKIVVFESDDWGMIRMASKDAYERLLKKGYPVDTCPYNRNDALESNSDVQLLGDVLSEFKDINNCPAKFTLNNIVANPNFDAIKSSLYTKYDYEPFWKTLEKQNRSDKVIDLYKEGIDKNVFQMQFHGREHLHVNNWLAHLQAGEKIFLDAFEEDMFTPYKEDQSSCKELALDGMATYSEKDFQFVSKSIEEGLYLFNKIWGFNSESVIAPCYTWHCDLEYVFMQNNIKYIQGGRVQREPIGLNERNKIRRKFLGQTNELGQVYMIRNVTFEQAENLNKDWVNEALGEMATAFFWNKPAIISSHRLNYIGSINEKNRERGIELLRSLLKAMLKRWPNIEFMSSDELATLISESRLKTK